MASAFVPAVAPRAELLFVKAPLSVCGRPPRRACLSQPVRMVSAIDTLWPPISVDKSGLRSPKSFESHENCLKAFVEYFAYMTGTWNSERTYHYQQPHAEREDSQTTFDVERLRPSQVAAVLESNGDATTSLSNDQRESTQGFNVSFLTRMASQSELVRASTNLAFVPMSTHQGGVICGDYYRDRGYEESAPIKASFSFDCAKMELTMTTFYTRVVSVDQISLINQSIRLRRIVNYKRPSPAQPIEDVVLVGFGIERKSPARLVS